MEDAMARQTMRNGQALSNLEGVDGLSFLWNSAARAPLRQLWPFTIFTGMVIGMAVGIAVGVPSNQLAYYIFKETINGFIAGFSAPLFLFAGRWTYRRWSRGREESKPVSNLLYSFAGALAGSLLIPMQWVLPPTALPMGLWVIFYPIGIAGLFPVIAAMADYTQLQREEHRQTKELFGKYVSESVARRIMEDRNHVTLTGEKRHCTVLFSDIRGFTRMVKDLGPEEVVQTLNEYFAAMIDIVFQFDGMVNKFIGDAVVVLYGAPVTLGNEASRAVQTAREMQRALGKMNDARVAAGKLPIHIGIGIDTGDVVVGNIGSTRRLEYTAIGEPVNNASYLGTIAPPDTVYISENVCCELDGSVALSPWKHVQLKGGTGEVMVYTLSPDQGEA
jgi:class 3 adenylate cyclase